MKLSLVVALVLMTLPCVAQRPDVLTFTDVMPRFPGGDEAMMSYLSKNLRYTAAMEKLKVEGKVVVKFVVEADGRIGNVTILQDIGGGAGQEVVRVVKGMPRWGPGFHNGKPVAVYFNLPVSFQNPNGKKKHRKQKDSTGQ